MLRILGKKMRVILIVTMAIIIPAFIFLFGPGFDPARPPEGRDPVAVIARVNGEEIFYREFRNTYWRIRERRRAVPGARWDEEMEAQLEREVLEQLIREALLRQEAERRGIRASDRDVLEEIKSRPHFQREGRFDRNLYLRILEFSRISPKDYEEEVRNDLRIRKLLRQVTEKAVISAEEVREEYIRRNEQVRVKYLLFPGEDFKEEVTVEEEKLREYFQANREEFRIPDRVNVEYIMISFKPEEMEVKEEEIADYYQEHLERYKKEGVEIPLEEVHMEIRDILANRKAEEKALRKARDLASDLFDRIAWETMVREKRLEVKETGFFARGEAVEGLGWAPDFVEEAFVLGEDEVSGAIRTPKGYAILIVKERSASHLPPLEEVKDKVEERVRERKARGRAREKAEECLKRLREGIDFEVTAQEFSREIKDSKLFSRRGYIEGIGFSLPFAETAFLLQEGEISPLVEVDQGFAILRGKERKGVDLDEEKFALEAERLREELLFWRQMEVYNQWYRTLKEGADIWIDPAQI